MGLTILKFLKDNGILIAVCLAVVFLWHDYMGSRETVAVLKTQMADQIKTTDSLRSDIRLRDFVQDERQDAAELLGGQINAANRMLDKIKTTPWATTPYPDDVRSALRVLEQGRPGTDSSGVRVSPQ